MIMKKAQFHSIHLPSIVCTDHIADVARLCGMKCKSLFSLWPVFTEDLMGENLSKRQIQTSIYNMVSRSK